MRFNKIPTFRLFIAPTPQFKRLKLAQQIVDAHNAKLEKLKIENCPHELVVRPWGSVSCNICKKSFGWSCPKSPDKVCHYECEIEDGEIALIDGTFTPSSTGIQEEEGSEYCIYCGQPDERK